MRNRVRIRHPVYLAACPNRMNVARLKYVHDYTRYSLDGGHGQQRDPAQGGTRVCRTGSVVSRRDVRGRCAEAPVSVCVYLKDDVAVFLGVPGSRYLMRADLPSPLPDACRSGCRCHAESVSDSTAWCERCGNRDAGSLFSGDVLRQALAAPTRPGLIDIPRKEHVAIAGRREYA